MKNPSGTGLGKYRLRIMLDQTARFSDRRRARAGFRHRDCRARGTKATDWQSLAEVVPLREILSGGVVAVRVFLGHEGVAEIDVEIRLVGQRVGEGVLIDGGLGVFVEMRIRSDGEGERTARRAGGVECELGAVSRAPSEIGRRYAGVGLQRREHDFRGLALS